MSKERECDITVKCNIDKALNEEQWFKLLELTNQIHKETGLTVGVTKFRIEAGRMKLEKGECKCCHKEVDIKYLVEMIEDRNDWNVKKDDQVCNTCATKIH